MGWKTTTNYSEYYTHEMNLIYTIYKDPYKNQPVCIMESNKGCFSWLMCFRPFTDPGSPWSYIFFTENSPQRPPEVEDIWKAGHVPPIFKATGLLVLGVKLP